MNDSLSSGLNPPPILHFSPFSLFVCPLAYSLPIVNFSPSYLASSLFALTSSHCLFLYFSVISHSFLSIFFSLSERSFLSQLCPQKAVWWHWLAVIQNSAL